jgi:hypothetical protein
MRPFAERNPVVVGLVGLALTVVAVVISLSLNNLPFSKRDYVA